MRILQAHNHHDAKGGAMEVLAHERELLLDAGHEVEQYTLPAAEDLQLSGVRAGVKAVWNREAACYVYALVDRLHVDALPARPPSALMSPPGCRGPHAGGGGAVAAAHSSRYSRVVGTWVRDGRSGEDSVAK